MGRNTESFEALQRSLKYIQDPLYYASSMGEIGLGYDARERKMKENLKRNRYEHKRGRECMWQVAFDAER